MKKVLLGLAGLVVAGFIGLAVVYVATAPEGPPLDSESAMTLEGGQYSIATMNLTLTDPSRPTQANNDYQGADSRTLETAIWYPEGDVGDSLPLVIYSHGFMSDRDGGSYLARSLASQGYVVASADFPLTNLSAPGGPNAADVVNQPADVSFLIDQLLGLDSDEASFAGKLDEFRIGVMGLSLGGLTATLVAYHPRWRDQRIRAAVSIAGPAAMFTRRFFLTSGAPLLMIAGTEDAIVDYDANAAIIPDRAPRGTLLTIKGASHTGFASLAEPSMRFMHHPDSLGCDALQANLSRGDAEAGGEGEGGAESDNPFAMLGSLDEGVDIERSRLSICSKPLVKSLHPGRQQMIATVGTVSFFESILSLDAETRKAARTLLNSGLAADFPEASITR